MYQNIRCDCSMQSHPSIPDRTALTPFTSLCSTFKVLQRISIPAVPVLLPAAATPRWSTSAAALGRGADREVEMEQSTAAEDSRC